MTKKTLIAAAGLAVLAGCGDGSANKMVFRHAPVVRTSLVRTVDATGKVTPRNTANGVPVGAQVTGKVIKLLVDYNESVTNGQVIILIDPTSYRATYEAAEAQNQVDLRNVEVAEAEVAVSKSALEFNEATWNRKRTLEKGALPELEREKARSDFDSAKASLKRAEAKLASARSTAAVSRAFAAKAKADLDYCTIRSPVNGVVISRKIEEGSTVVSTYSTTPILTIAEDLKTVWIEATIPESEVGGIRVGQTVTFSVDAYQERFTGRVRQIRRDATSTNNVVTYPVIVEADNPGEKLFPGMTATVSIETGRAENAPVVSVAALRYVPEPNDRATGAQAPANGVLWFENAAGKLEPVPVKTGLSDDNFIVLEDADALVGRNAVAGKQSASAAAADTVENPFFPKQSSVGNKGSAPKPKGK